MEDELLVGLFKQEVYRFLFPKRLDSIVDSFEQILQFARTGPGSSIAARGTDFYTKLFSSKLSTTSEGLYLAYKNYVKDSPLWSSAEQQRFDHFGGPTIVGGNRLSFVPKNVDTARVICTEPNLNMYFQLGLGHLIEKRLKSFFGIDLATQQEINRELAQIGSANDSLSTIDLSSASDTVSWKMIQQLFPRDFVAWLGILRSPKVTLPDGSEQELFMVSSMGNGFTFPLETLIFSCVVAAAYYAHGLDLRRSKGYEKSTIDLWSGNVRIRKPRVTRLGNFGVFGDDIIVEKEVYRKVAKLLELLGFQINVSKSFVNGPFRESCGGDYYLGHPVRGVYIKTLQTPASRYVAINRLNEWSAITGIPLPKTIHRLMKSVRFTPVPLYENDDAGIKVPFDLAGFVKRDTDTQSVVYRRWASVPQRIRLVDGALLVPKGSKSRIYNPDGLLITGLRGDIDNNSLSIRLGAPRYCMKRAISPCWDWLPTVGEQSPVDQWRLASAIRRNMTNFMFNM
jgi:hypothetical protein